MDINKLKHSLTWLGHHSTIWLSTPVALARRKGNTENRYHSRSGGVLLQRPRIAQGFWCCRIVREIYIYTQLGRNSYKSSPISRTRHDVCVLPNSSSACPFPDSSRTPSIQRYRLSCTPGRSLARSLKSTRQAAWVYRIESNHAAVCMWPISPEA